MSTTNDSTQDEQNADYEADPAYCTEFTTDHGLDDDQMQDDEFYFGFVCSGEDCGEVNSLKGDPLAFRDKPFKCEHCGWVSLLVGESLEAFAADAEDNA